MIRRFLLACVLVMLAPGMARAANPAVVQFITAYPSGTVTSTTTAAIATTSGNTLVAILTAFGNQIGATPIADSGSHTWVQAIASTGTTEGWIAVYYVANITGSGSHTFTFTANAATNLVLTVIELSGIATSTPLNNTDADSTTGSVTHTSGPISADDGICEIFIGGGSVSETSMPNITDSVSIDWNPHHVRSDANHEGSIWGWRFVASGTSDSWSATQGASDRDTAFIAGFKAATACTSPTFEGPTSSSFVQ